jgi:hypothetical protein
MSDPVPSTYPLLEVRVGRRGHRHLTLQKGTRKERPGNPVAPGPFSVIIVDIY